MQKPFNLALKAAAWFFVEQGSEEEGMQDVVAIQTPFVIGRKPGVDLKLPCTSVSGKHAEIIEQDGHMWLRDLESTNGTFVNGVRIKTKARLTENDTVQFGTTVFQISKNAGTDSSPRQNEESDSSSENRLERLFSGGIVPFFQPVMTLAGAVKSIYGYEVLGRSRLFGLRTPAQMFAAASRLEMEAELSRVLRKQGVQVADTELGKNVTLFVNTHPAELECEGLEESLFELREDHPDRLLMLELHESALNKSEQLVQLRSTLKSLNIGLAFHNFGAGQIQLAELGEVCPDVVKFDVSLTQGIDRASSKRQQFLGSLVNMVSGLGITPIAECIEQPDEHETIVQLGFKMAQGFLYGRPSSIADCSRPREDCYSEPMVKSFLIESPGKRANVVSSAGIIPHGPKDADWLLTQPESHYTIQVLSAISQERAEEYIAKQANPDQFAIFCKQGKTRTLYIVVYGVFADRAAAKTASADLVNSTISPWIRMLSGVHAEILPGK